MSAQWNSESHDRAVSLDSFLNMHFRIEDHKADISWSENSTPVFDILKFY